MNRTIKSVFVLVVAAGLALVGTAPASAAAGGHAVAKAPVSVVLPAPVVSVGIGGVTTLGAGCCRYSGLH